MVNQVLLEYSYLQLLDLLTTLAFLMHGLQEGNPLVRLALFYAPHPLTGLVLVKAAAVALGVVCWKLGRLRLLSRVNVLFAIVVAWNVAALIVSAA